MPRILSLLLFPFFLYCGFFEDHYVDWRLRRVQAIIQHYGKDWFSGKKILELGCGYADIGHQFYLLGADVTVSDARQEHLDVVQTRYPHLKRVLSDQDQGWCFDDHYDLIIHMGLLYHLKDPSHSIFLSTKHCNFLVLETECSDSDDPFYCLETEELGFDQAFNHKGSRPSPAFVERCLDLSHFKYTAVNDNRCNSSIHHYDWPIKNSGLWHHGQRRMWFCEKR